MCNCLSFVVGLLAAVVVRDGMCLWDNGLLAVPELMPFCLVISGFLLCNQRLFMLPSTAFCWCGVYCVKLGQSYKKFIKRPSLRGENVLVGGFSVFFAKGQAVCFLLFWLLCVLGVSWFLEGFVCCVGVLLVFSVCQCGYRKSLRGHCCRSARERCPAVGPVVVIVVMLV